MQWEKVDTKNPTQAYQPGQSTEAWGGYTSALLDSSPLFTWFDIPRMCRDERIQLCIRMLVSPFQRVKWSIKASSPAVGEFVADQTKRFWKNFVSKIMRRYFKWGFVPVGWQYAIVTKGRMKNKIGLKKVDIIEPMDAFPLEYKSGPKKNQFAGFRFPGGGAIQPYASWFAGEAEINRYYDWPRLRGAFNPWLEKNGRTGAKHSRRLAAATAWDGGALRFPTQPINIGTDENPNWVSGQAYAMQVMSKQEAGTRMALPNTPHPAMQGEYAWTIDRPNAVGNLSYVMDYPSQLDREIDAGMGVLTELVQSTEQGGWSGKQITAESFYNSEDELVNLALQMWQDTPLKYLLNANFGPAAECEIVAESLVETMMPKPQGAPSQPGQPGFGGTQMQPPARPPESVGPADLFGGNDDADGGAKDFSDVGGEAVERDVKSTFRNSGSDDAAARKAVILAMIEIQEEATARGNPKAAEPWLDELAELAKDPNAVRRLLGQSKPADFAWQADGTSKSGKPRWLETSTGERRYQKSEPGSRAKARERREASDSEATKILSKISRFEATADDVEGLADHLPAASLDKLRLARKTLGASFGGQTRRQEMIDSLLTHVAERVRGQRAGEEERKKSEPKEEPRKPADEEGKIPENPEPNKVYNVDPKSLVVDPKRFQFKLNTDNAAGVTEELKGVKYNPDFAGVISVWKDPEDGKTYVVNGHHRHDLASRTDAKNISIRYLNAGSAQEARGKGALINIAEGRGTAIDAAKFMRDTGVTLGQFAEEGISLKGAVARDAVELSKLSDGIFHKLTRGEIEQPKALAIASNIPDTEMQDQFLRYVDKIEDRKGIEISPKVLASMAKDWAKAPTRTKVESTLFGDEESKESLFHDRHELKSYVDEQLAKEARDFEAVSSEKRAGRVAEEGNVLETEKNRQRAATANRLRDILSTAGEWSNILDTGAEEHANAKTTSGRNKVKQQYLERIRTALSEAHTGEIQGMGGRREATPTTGDGGNSKVEKPVASNKSDSEEIVDLKKADEPDPVERDLFGGALPKKFTSKSGEQLKFDDHIGNIWVDKAKDWADTNGLKINKFGFNGEFESGGKRYRVGNASEGYHVVELS